MNLRQKRWRMSEEAIVRRKARDRERYLRQREERLARQREYYRDNRDEILAKKREKALEKPCVAIKSKSRAEIYHDWYLRNREAKKAASRRRYQEQKNANAMMVI